MRIQYFQLSPMFFAVLLLLLCAVTASAEDNIATVNGTAISKQYFTRVVEAEKQRLLSRTGTALEGEDLQATQKQVLKNLIEGELLFQESKKNKIQVDVTQVDSQLAQLKSRFPSEESYQGWLTQMKITEADIKLDIQKGLAVDSLIKTKLVPQIQIADSETKSFYDNNPQFFQRQASVRASHILIKVEDGATDEEKKVAMDKIKVIQKKIKSGDDFTTLAKENSECPSSAQGGDLNFFEKGKMVPEFDNAAFSLKKDEMSDIVTTQFGYHLIKVTDIKPEETAALGDVQDQIKQFLLQQRVKIELEKYVEQLKKDAKVERFLEEG
ncbi:peptidylprolyl isomerase [Thermodesulfobacteriota bacterium]